MLPTLTVLATTQLSPRFIHDGQGNKESFPQVASLSLLMYIFLLTYSMGQTVAYVLVDAPLRLLVPPAAGFPGGTSQPECRMHPLYQYDYMHPPLCR